MTPVSRPPAGAQALRPEGLCPTWRRPTPLPRLGPLRRRTGAAGGRSSSKRGASSAGESVFLTRLVACGPAPTEPAADGARGAIRLGAAQSRLRWGARMGSPWAVRLALPGCRGHGGVRRPTKAEAAATPGGSCRRSPRGGGAWVAASSLAGARAPLRPQGRRQGRKGAATGGQTGRGAAPARSLGSAARPSAAQEGHAPPLPKPSASDAARPPAAGPAERGPARSAAHLRVRAHRGRRGVIGGVAVLHEGLPPPASDRGCRQRGRLWRHAPWGRRAG